MMIVTFLIVGIRMSTSLIFAALGGVFSFRSGVVNIALEGMMLIGAFLGVFGAHYLGNPWIGVLVAMIGGGFLGFVHAILCVKFKANQAVSGVGIILLATGLTAFGVRTIFGQAGSTPQVAALNKTEILSAVPGVGEFLSQFPPFVYIAILLVLVSHYVLYRTPLGLRIVSVGENPHAADTLGVKVARIRIGCGIVSGALCGLAGSYISLGQLNLFQEGMTSGRGFIALAAVIMGKWTPLGAFLACLLFGFADALQVWLQVIPNNPIDPEIMLTLPYILALIVLGGLVGKAFPPASLGKHYDRSER
jgi:simple sugar transport system permease protein